MVYHPTKEWDEALGDLLKPGPAGYGHVVVDPAAYVARDGLPTMQLTFSDDGVNLELTLPEGGGVLYAKRETRVTNEAWFWFGAGHFGVHFDGGLEAEFTRYGSGVPITYSSRGYIE